jgi:hypothetical protein
MTMTDLPLVDNRVKRARQLLDVDEVEAAVGSSIVVDAARLGPVAGQDQPPPLA